MEITRHWRLQRQRYRFEGVRYAFCGHLSLQDRPVCPQCAEEKNNRFNDGAPLPLPLAEVVAPALLAQIPID